MPKYEKVAAEDGAVEGPPRPPSAPPPSRKFLDEQRGDGAPPPPSAPPPSRTFVSEQRTSAPPPSVPRPSVHSVQPRDGPVKPPSLPPPSKSFVRAQQTHAGTASTVSRPSASVPIQSFHAQIGDSIPSSALEAIASSMTIEARKKFHQKKFDEALHGFQVSGC